MSALSDQETEVFVYRKVQRWSVYVGLVLLALTFFVYVSGLVEPYIPLSDLDDFWALGVRDYTEAADIETGWVWLGMIRYADFLNFVGIAFLASVTILCYGAIIPVLVGEKKTIYAALAIMQVLVLVLAASGLIGVG